MTVDANRHAPARADADTWLAWVPVPLFAVGMGLGGLGIAWRRAAQQLGLPDAVGEALVALGAAGFLLVALLYLGKALRHPGRVAADYASSASMTFYPAISISLMVLASGALPYSEGLAAVLWFAGIGLHLAFAVVILNRWITGPHQIVQMNPAWFLPVVGNILAPGAGVPLGHVQISWFFFAIGLVYWAVLFVIVVYRIVFHDPLPSRVLPTLFILMAPPAIGTYTLTALTGAFGPGSLILFGTSLFTCLVLASMARHFLAVAFSVAWWAYTFPLAITTTAAFVYHAHLPSPGIAAIALVLLAVATIVIGLVTIRTAIAALRGDLFRPDPAQIKP